MRSAVAEARTHAQVDNLGYRVETEDVRNAVRRESQTEFSR